MQNYFGLETEWHHRRREHERYIQELVERPRSVRDRRRPPRTFLRQDDIPAWVCGMLMPLQVVCVAYGRT